jgi:NACalpha-BTF3-like transcription factor
MSDCPCGAVLVNGECFRGDSCRLLYRKYGECDCGSVLTATGYCARDMHYGLVEPLCKARVAKIFSELGRANGFCECGYPLTATGVCAITSIGFVTIDFYRMAPCKNRAKSASGVAEQSISPFTKDLELIRSQLDGSFTVDEIEQVYKSVNGDIADTIMRLTKA